MSKNIIPENFYGEFNLNDVKYYDARWVLSDTQIEHAITLTVKYLNENGYNIPPTEYPNLVKYFKNNWGKLHYDEKR